MSRGKDILWVGVGEVPSGQAGQHPPPAPSGLASSPCPQSVSAGSEDSVRSRLQGELFWVGFQSSHCSPGKEVSCSKNFPSKCSGSRAGCEGHVGWAWRVGGEAKQQGPVTGLRVE